MNESSRVQGSRYGGFSAQWGLSETTLPAASDGKISQVNLVQNRLLLQTIVSRDIWTDARKIQRWLSYIGHAMFRDSIEQAMVSGALNGPTGAIASAATVVVPAQGGQSAGTIVYQNIDAAWSAMYSGCKENACWHCSDDTVQYLDELATSGQFPENLYFPAGLSPMGTPWATIKGKPLYPSEWCPSVGNPGDLFCIDWGEYVFSYMQVDPTQSPLSFYVDLPNDSFHRGLVGIPEGSVEQRVSDQLYFDTDRLALVFKFRGDGQFIWSGTMTNKPDRRHGGAVCGHHPTVRRDVMPERELVSVVLFAGPFDGVEAMVDPPPRFS